MARQCAIGLLCVLILLLVDLSHAKINCAHVTPDGYIFNMANLTYITVGPGYTALDGEYRFQANICGLVSEANCKAAQGYACMYNRSSTEFEYVLATADPKYEVPSWVALGEPSEHTGIVLLSRNGFYGVKRAIVRLELKCQPDAPHTNVLTPNLNYQDAIFKFGLATPWACPIGTTSLSVSVPNPLPRTGAGSVYVTATSLPPADVTIQCSSPNLLISPMHVTFRGPENGVATTIRLDVGLAQNLDLSVGWFVMSCDLSGSNATIYTYPRTVNVTVAPPAPPPGPNPHGHTQLSGGSIFLIILFVCGFCYILFGVLYNWRIKGAEIGWGLFPHLDMWKGIWESAKDGNAYFFGHLLRIKACRRTTGGSTAGSYEEVH